MYRRSYPAIMATLFLIFVLFTGCSESTAPASENQPGDQVFSKLESVACPAPDDVPPAGLVTVSLGDQSLEFWPYTGENFTGTAQDPINLIFYGKADPREIMAALMSLDGNRTDFGFPDEPPFNQTWQDAVGFVQTTYGTGYGWVAGAVQLACGDYGPIRFHIRLFRMGIWTVGNAHFEVLIEGTSDHQVLSWELAEQLVIADFMRSGLLDGAMPVIPVGQINQGPFRGIPWYIYNELPQALKDIVGGPETVSDSAMIPSDGQAVILNLANSVPVQADSRSSEFDINYSITMPKPFCASGEYDLVNVQGPVHLVQKVWLTDSHIYHMTFHAQGQLFVTPINGQTGEPSGETYIANVREKYLAFLSDKDARAESMLFQIMIPEDEDVSWIYKKLIVKSVGRDGFLAMQHCGGE
jgi:hypothetical protein